MHSLCVPTSKYQTATTDLRRMHVLQRAPTSSTAQWRDLRRCKANGDRTSMGGTHRRHGIPHASGGTSIRVRMEACASQGTPCLLTSRPAQLAAKVVRHDPLVPQRPSCCGGPAHGRSFGCVVNEHVGGVRCIGTGLHVTYVKITPAHTRTAFTHHMFRL